MKCGLSRLVISDERYNETSIKDTSTYVYKDHLSLKTTVGCSMGHFSDTTAPLYKDHLSTETTVGCSMGHLSDTNAPLYKDHLSTETTITQFLELLFQAHFTLLYTGARVLLRPVFHRGGVS